jgi:hypothetical protein
MEVSSHALMTQTDVSATHIDVAGHQRPSSQWPGSVEICNRIFLGHQLHKLVQRLIPCPSLGFSYDSIPSHPKSWHHARPGLVVGSQTVGLADVVWGLLWPQLTCQSYMTHILYHLTNMQQQPVSDDGQSRNTWWQTAITNTTTINSTDRRTHDDEW